MPAAAIRASAADETQRDRSAQGSRAPQALAAVGRQPLCRPSPSAPDTSAACRLRQLRQIVHQTVRPRELGASCVRQIVRPGGKSRRQAGRAPVSPAS